MSSKWSLKTCLDPLNTPTPCITVSWHLVSLFFQTKLLNRFLILLECRKTDPAAFQATLDKVMKCLPIAQLQLPATIKVLTEKWVWLKRSVAHGKSAEVDTNERSVLHLLGNSPPDLQTAYLEFELGLYMESRHPSHSAMVTVLRDLVQLHSQLGSSLQTAQYTVQLAAACLHCSSHCCHALEAGPQALLDQALKMLVGIDHAPKWKVQQVLATAHLWKAVMVFQRNVR